MSSATEAKVPSKTRRGWVVKSILRSIFTGEFKGGDRLVEEEILARFEVRQLPEQGREPFLRTLEHERVVGGRVYDAHIAEIARLSGAKVVVTDNRRHFLSLARHGIRVLGAEEFARSTRFAR